MTLSTNLAAIADRLIAAHDAATMLPPITSSTPAFSVTDAYVVLGESLGSTAANLWAGRGRLAVGIEINATHTRSATSGWPRTSST